MKLGLYIFVALLLILATGSFIYTLDLGVYRLDIINMSLPITVWILLPMIFLFLFTVGHMFFYNVKNYFKLKKWQKDANTLEDALYWSLVNEPKGQKYSMDEVGSSAVLLSKSSLSVSDNIEGLSPRLSRVVNIIQKIKNGEYIDLKIEKMSKVFNPGNPVLIQNRLNRLESDDKFVEEVMKDNSSYSKAVQKEALEIFARKADFEQARKYTKLFDVKNFLLILNRVSSEDNLCLNKEILSAFIEDLQVSCADFMKIAEVTKKYFKPDENLEMFNKYQKENEKAQNAYLYLLFEYELSEQVDKFLDEEDADKFIKFRAFHQLKGVNSRYKLEDIVDIHNVCSETKFL